MKTLMLFEWQRLWRSTRYVLAVCSLLFLSNILFSRFFFLNELIKGLLFALSIATAVVGSMVLFGIWIFAFYRSLCGREAPLTLALPLSVPRLLLAKILPGMVITAIFIGVADLALFWQSLYNPQIKPFLELVNFELLGMSFSGREGLRQAILLGELSYLLSYSLGSAGIVLQGGAKKLARFGGAAPFLIYFLYALVSQLFSFLLLFMSKGTTQTLDQYVEQNRGGLVGNNLLLGLVLNLLIFAIGVWRLSRHPFVRS